MDKAQLRALMRARRRAVTTVQRNAASQSLCNRLAALIPSNSLVAIYFATPQELSLEPFIKGTSCTLVAPRWNPDAHVYELAPLTDSLVPGPLAIPEPAATAPRVDPARVDVWIVPGLAFTPSGQRLGYGGGWYDRLLAQARDSALRLGVGYDFQLVAELPVEAHDRALTRIVTVKA